MFFSKKDYKVKLRGRSEIEYCEGDRKLIIGSEFLAGTAGVVIYSTGLSHWEPPHEAEALSEADLARVKSNVLADLKRHKIKAEWTE